MGVGWGCDGMSVSLCAAHLPPTPHKHSILHDDAWLTAFSKEPGLVVQPCESAATGTLLHGAVHYWGGEGKGEKEQVPILASPTQVRGEG